LSFIASVTNPVSHFSVLESNLVNLERLSNCLELMSSGNKEGSIRLFENLPKNFKDATFEAMWVLSGGPSAESSDLGLKAKAHPRFGELAFFDQVIAGIDRSTPTELKVAAMKLGFQKALLKELKRECILSNSSTLSKISFLEGLGHKFSLNPAVDISRKLEILNDIYHLIPETQSALLSDIDRLGKNLHVFKLGENAIAFFGSNDVEFGQLKEIGGKFLTKLLLKKVLEKYPHLSMLFASNGRDNTLVSALPVSETKLAATDSAQGLQALEISKNDDLIFAMQSRSACFNARRLMLSANEAPAADIIRSSEGIKNVVYKNLEVLSEKNTISEVHSDFGCIAFEESSDLRNPNRRVNLQDKIQALMLAEPLDHLNCLLSMLEGEENKRFDALHQYSYILPGRIVQKIDSRIMELGGLSAKDTLSSSPIVGKTAHPDVPLEIKIQAVRECIEEYRVLLLDIEAASLSYRNAKSYDEKVDLATTVLNKIMPILSSPVEKFKLRKIKSSSLTGKFLDYIQINPAYKPYIALLIGSSNLDTTLTEASKTHTMTERLELLKEDKDYPSGLDSLRYKGENWKVLSLNLSAQINMAKDRFISVGEGVINREMILFDPALSPELDKFYTEQLLQDEFLLKKRSLKMQLAYISRTVYLSFKDFRGVGEENLLNAFVKKWKRDNPITKNPESYFTVEGVSLSAPIIPIDEFIKEKVGICRHRSLISGYFIARLKEERPDLFDRDGRILHMRSALEDKTGHAWLWYQPNDGSPIIHIDPMWDSVVTLDEGIHDEYSSRPYIQTLKERVKNLSL